VPHDGPIKITVTPNDRRSPQRTILLRPGTEVAVTNMAEDYPHIDAERERSHFQIYEQLSSPRVSFDRHLSLATPPAAQEKAPASPSTHAMFRRPKPASLTVNCSNTGCCSG